VSGLTPWRIRMAVWEGNLPAHRDGKSRRSAFVVMRSDLESFLRQLPTVEPSNAAWLVKRRAEVSTELGRAA